MPAAYADLFRGAGHVLASHRGWDPGAMELARRLSRALRAPLIACSTSRLVVDANRSRDNPTVLSEWTKRLDQAERERMLRRCYDPHRGRVGQCLTRLAGNGSVVHLGVHTFTPVLRGVRRTTDLGVLFDPSRPLEVSLCRAWRAAIREIDPALRVRFNYPYRGTSDALTTAMRARFSPGEYLGIELEVNQRFPRGDGRTWLRLQRTVSESLQAALALTPPRGPAPRPRTDTSAPRARSRPG